MYHHDYRLSNIRALAITLVVIGHSIILYSYTWNLLPTAVQCLPLDKLKDVIYLCHMQLFFLVSGYLFLNTMQKSSMKNIVVNKARRLLIPYVIIGFLWMIPLKLIVGVPFYKDICLWQVVLRFMLGIENGHLWFVYALMWMFVLTLLTKVLNGYNHVIGGGILCVLFVISEVDGRMTLGHYLCLSHVQHYFFWFFLGFQLKLGNRYLRYILPVLLILTLVMGRYNMSWQLILSLAIWFLVPNKKNDVALFIDSHSYGLYLLHSPLVYITFTYMADDNPWIVAMINVFVMGGMALGLTHILMKSPISFVVGKTNRK